MTVPDSLPLSRRSVSWRVNAEPLVFAGGARALLMQVAHPGVGAGVEQHSTYASDPWARLFRTVDIMMKLSYGSATTSLRQQELLASMHRRVVGTTDLGQRYSAFDPDLQLWVWATLVDTALLVYERVRGPLTKADRDQFYAESKLVAYGCGVPRGRCPDAWDDFTAYIDRVVETDLQVTRSARAVATVAMVPPLPLPGPVLAAAAAPHQLVTVGLMAPSLREQYGFTWNNTRQRRLDTSFALVSAATALVPTPVRQAGAQLALRQRKPMRFPWLQRRGAEMTKRQLEAAGFS